MFLFKFINVFNTFFYLAFFKEAVDPCQPIYLHSCMYQLRIQVGTIFIVQLFLGFMEIGAPMVKYWWNLRKEKGKLTYTEKQFRRDPHPGTLEEFMELVLQFGFVTLFPVALPLVPLLALFSNLFEIRTDAMKMVYALQRPFPIGADGIGAWKGILQCVTVMSVMVNVGLVCFSMQISNTLDWFWKVLIFLILEHIIFGFKALVMYVIPDEPESVTIGRAREKEIIKEAISGKESDRELEHHKIEDIDGRLREKDNDSPRYCPEPGSP